LTETFKNLFINVNIKKNNGKYKYFLLADKGYDSKTNRLFLIPQNRRKIIDEKKYNKIE
jgi:hypothetical protein